MRAMAFFRHFHCSSNVSQTRHLMKIKAIFLDMDHTLCDTDKADQEGVTDFQQLLQQDFPVETATEIGSEYLEVIYGKHRNLPDWQRNETDTEVGYRARLLANTISLNTENRLAPDKLSYYAQSFMDLRIKHFDFFPGVVAMLQRLRKKYVLILVTNGPLFSQEPKIAKTNMSQHVDEIIIGGALKHQKPHASIFELACRKARCIAGEAVHVGDRLDSDIQGALNANITSVWLDPIASKDYPDSSPNPDHIIHDICELEQLITSISTKDSI